MFNVNKRNYYMTQKIDLKQTIIEKFLNNKTQLNK